MSDPLQLSTGCSNISGSPPLNEFILAFPLGNFRTQQEVCQTDYAAKAASIVLQEEFKTVIQLLDTAKVDLAPSLDGNFGIYIGLFSSIVGDVGQSNDTSRFEWLDGSEFDFGTVPLQSPWLAGRPDNEFEEEDCVSYG